MRLQLRGEPICTCCRLSEGSEQAFGHPVQDRVWDPLLTKHIPVRRLWPLSCSTTREAHRAPHSAGGCPLVSTATPASFSQQEQARDLENLRFVFIFSNLHLLPQLVLNMPGVKLQKPGQYLAHILFRVEFEGFCVTRMWRCWITPQLTDLQSAIGNLTGDSCYPDPRAERRMDVHAQSRAATDSHRVTYFTAQKKSILVTIFLLLKERSRQYRCFCYIWNVSDVRVVLHSYYSHNLANIMKTNLTLGVVIWQLKK